MVTLELGGYLIEPYDADVCFDAQVRSLLVGAGDEMAALRSIATSRARRGRDAPVTSGKPARDGSPVRGDQAGFVGEDDELGAVAGTQLGHGPADVGLHGSRADHHVGGDLVVGETAGYKRDHLAFTVSQGLELRRARFRAPGDVFTDQLARDTGREQRLSSRGDTYPVQQAARPSPVAPARRSPSARAKDATKHTPGGQPVHSLATLLADLATIAASRVQPAAGLPAFTVITTPTPLQRRAFELLGVSHRLGHA